jgi:hypothetical protein
MLRILNKGSHIFALIYDIETTPLRDHEEPDARHLPALLLLI